MSAERVQGKENKEHGKAEEKIGKEFGDKERELAGKEQKELGKAQEKAGKDMEKKGYTTSGVAPTTGTTTGSYVCASCGATFATADERERHNEVAHRTTTM